MSRPRVIFFDAVGTLLHLRRGVGEHYREVALRHGLNRPAEAWQQAFGQAWKAAAPPVTTREPRPDDDRGWWQALVEEVLAACNAPADFARAAFFAELYDSFAQPGVWQLFPETRDVLEVLRSRGRLGIISNFDGRLRTILKELELLPLFEVVAISSELGADKPEPWIFQEAARRAQTEPGACLHVGDDPACDWQGARASGMEAFELDRPHNSLRQLLEFTVKGETICIKSSRYPSSGIRGRMWIVAS